MSCASFYPYLLCELYFLPLTGFQLLTGSKTDRFHGNKRDRSQSNESSARTAVSKADGGQTTAPSASRMTRILLVALSVAGRRAKQPTGAPNASHHGGKNSNCRHYVQNEGDVSRWCGRITARDQPGGTPDILVIFPLVSIHNSP